ncbi:MAG: M56 family metallopeptidase [Oscillospiraceae bacterium]|nr:M56 family metallopeptidase [Oscillospiraceae bacterium]
MDIIGRSLSAAAVIAVIIFLRRIMFRKMPKRVLSSLWLIAAAKLLLPSMGIAVTEGFAADTVVTETVYPVHEIVSAIPEAVINVAVPVSESNLFVSLCGYIWLFGAVFAGAVFAIYHIKSRRTFSCAVPADYNIEPLKNEFGILRSVRLLVSDRTDSPLTYGIFSPVIILPKSMDMRGGDERNVLCHELAHIKRFDALFKALLAVCAAVYWFNPVVWIMFAFANRDIELACDETALRRGKTVPEDYAMTLISVEEKRCVPAGKSFPLAGSFSGGSLEERIRDVMTKKKSAFAGISAAVLSAAAAAVFNVTVMPYGTLAYDLAVSDVSADIQEYSYYVTSDSSDYIAVEESPAAEYSSMLVEDVSLTDYSEEVSGTYSVISVSEDIPKASAVTGGTANDQQYPQQGSYTVVYDYPTYAYAVAISESGEINSDTVMVIKINNSGFEVGRQTQITPIKSR